MQGSPSESTATLTANLYACFGGKKAVEKAVVWIKTVAKMVDNIEIPGIWIEIIMVFGASASVAETGEENRAELLDQMQAVIQAWLDLKAEQNPG